MNRMTLLLRWGAVSLSVTTMLTLPIGASAAVTHSASPRELWVLPVAEPTRIIRPFDLPGGEYQAGHRGVDIHTKEGADIFAPTNGEISYVGVVVDRPLVSLRVSDNVVLSLEPVDSPLHLGASVQAGDKIGELAEQLHCSTPCVHLGVRVQGSYINPLRFLAHRPQLLPLNAPTKR